MLNSNWLLDLGTAPVIWSEQGDEWLHWLSVAVGEAGSDLAVTGHRFDATTEPFIRVAVQSGSGPDGFGLFLGVTEVEVRVLAGGVGEPPSQGTLALLADAVRGVASRMGSDGDEHPWSAVIGHAAERIGGTEKRLGRTFEIGPLRVESSGVTFSEPDTSHQAAFGAWSLHSSVPLLVQGSSRGYAWEAAGMRAARDLRTVSGLLSLAWDSSFVVREAAAPLDWGVRRPPESPPWYSTSDLAMETPGEAQPPPGEEVEAPPWLAQAWTCVQDDRKLLAALDAYLEGVYAEGRHPSLAAVAFTACVETVAAKVYHLERCESCGSQIGIGRSFKAALRLVLSEDQAQEMDAVYGVRSRTVHAGRLHGEETSPGAINMGLWTRNGARDFRWRTLRNLRRASGALLQLALQGALPPRSRLPSPRSGLLT